MAKRRNNVLPLRIVLLTLGALGTTAIWGGAVVDGSLWLLLKAVFSREYIMPGTQTKLKKSLTGIYWPIDFLLNILITFFWEAVDGSHPTASATGLYFLSQYLPILVVLYSDHFRAGNAGLKRSLTPWLLAFQCGGIGCVGPFWALSYLSSSPLMQLSTRSSLRAASAMRISSLLALPVTLALGYILPSALMGLKSPTVVSADFQQKAIAVWNVFPLWTLNLQLLVESGLNTLVSSPTGAGAILALLIRAGPSPSYKSSSSSESVPISESDSEPGSHMPALRLVNGLALATSFAAHAVFVGLSASTVLFPGIWAPGMADALSPSALFIPPVFRSFSSTVGDGVRGFLMWDQAYGYIVANLVAFVQLKTVAAVCGAKLKAFPALLSMAFGSVVLGPGSICLIVSWVGDEILYEGCDAVSDRKDSIVDIVHEGQERKLSVAGSGYATPDGHLKC